MDLLLVAPCFPPQHAIAALRTHAFARTWADAGHRVTVLTTAKRPDQCGLDLPCDGFSVVELDYRVPWLFERLRGRHRAAQPVESERTARRGWFGALRRLKERTGVFSQVRMPDLTDWWIAPATAWARTAGPWDAVVSSSGPPAALLAARAIKRAGRARYWAADFRDLWTEHHLYSGLFPFTLRERAEERACLREADLLVTVSEGLAGKLTARARRPVEVIYNGFDDADQLPAEPAFAPDGLLRLVYTGTLYERGQDTTTLLVALNLLPSQQRQRLRLVVAGPSGAAWRALARTHGVEAMVEDHGLLPRSTALRLQRDAAALVLLDWRDPSEGVLTGKAFEYLCADAPILLIGGASDSPLARLLARAGRGTALGDDPRRIAAVLAELLADPVRIAPAPDAAFIATLSRREQSLRLLRLLGRLQRGAARAG